MSKSSRQKASTRAARKQKTDQLQASREKAAVRRLIALDRAATTRNQSLPAGFPVDYIDRLRAARHPLFKYADVDLQRMQQTGETPEQIFPPNSTCNEDRYAEHVARQATRHQNSNPWLFHPETIKSAVESMITEYRAVLSFLHAGSKTYFFGDALSESLSYTALNMPAPALRLPVPAFEFVFHSEAACEAFHAVSGMPMQAVRTISVFVREDTLKEVGFRRLIIAAYEHDAGFERPGAALIRRLAMREDWDLEGALKTDWDNPGMGPHSHNVSWATAPDGGLVTTEEGTANFLDEKMRFIRMVINGILYVTSRGAEITEKLATRPIRVGAHRRGDSTKPTDRPYSAVGESIRQIPVVIDPTVRYDPLSQPVGKRAVKVRFLVPGFWRRPPNSAPDARKDIWVSAHYRGPEMADLVNNPYVVR